MKGFSRSLMGLTFSRPIRRDSPSSLRACSYWDAALKSHPLLTEPMVRNCYQAPRSWTERAYSRLMYYYEAEKGGHFAAWEQPQIFTEELRAAFRPLRQVL